MHIDDAMIRRLVDGELAPARGETTSRVSGDSIRSRIAVPPCSQRSTRSML
jgi:hypothetical protein